MVLATFAIGAEPGQLTSRPGDTYEIRRVSDSSQSIGGDPSGSSHDKDTLIEKVIGLPEDGLELVYDLPKAATAQDRAGSWQFPVERRLIHE